MSEWDAFRAGFAVSGEGWNGEIAEDRGWKLEDELAAAFAKYLLLAGRLTENDAAEGEAA